MNEKVSFLTEDGVTVVGDYYEGGGEKAVLLLHMMPSTRASWVSFANQLVADGFSALAIDLRGHGESIVGSLGALDYNNFSDAEHRARIHDVETAVKLLEKVNGEKQLELFDDAGHGTTILERKPEYLKILSNWLAGR